MLVAHEVLAVAVVVVAALAAVWGLVAYRTGRLGGGPLGHVLSLVQTLLVAQVGLGLLLLSDGRRTADDLHYAYGTLALAAVLAPWFYAPREPRRRLLWFALATLLAGALGARAYLTAR
jgi:hypothetical protein